MDNAKDLDQKLVSQSWDNHINTLVDQEVKESVRHWYVKRVEQCIQHYPDERLRTHSSQHVVNFFTKIGREGRLSDWHNGNLSMLYGFFFAACCNLNSERAIRSSFAFFFQNN